MKQFFKISVIRPQKKSEISDKKMYNCVMVCKSADLSQNVLLRK